MKRTSKNGVYLPTLYVSRELHKKFETEWKRFCDHFGMRVTKAEFMRRVFWLGLQTIKAKLDQEVRYQQPPARLSEYQGQHVAIGPKGVVAHDEDLSKVVAKVRNLGVTDQVTFMCVPNEKRLT